VEFCEIVNGCGAERRQLFVSSLCENTRPADDKIAKNKFLEMKEASQVGLQLVRQNKIDPAGQKDEEGLVKQPLLDALLPDNKLQTDLLLVDLDISARSRYVEIKSVNDLLQLEDFSIEYGGHCLAQR